MLFWTISPSAKLFVSYKEKAQNAYSYPHFAQNLKGCFFAFLKSNLHLCIYYKSEYRSSKRLQSELGYIAPSSLCALNINYVDDMTTKWDIHDQIESAWINGEQAGLEAGIAKGKAEALRLMARAMINQLGVSAEAVSRISGLQPEEFME